MAYNRTMKQRIDYSLKLLLIVILLFAVMRGVLLFANIGYFQVLTPVQYLIGFVHGVRFDLAIMTGFLALPLLLLFLPSPLFKHPIFLNMLAFIVFIIVMTAVLALAMDVVYFQQVNRHVGAEVGYALEESTLLLKMLKAYAMPTGLFLAFMLLSAKIFFKWSNAHFRQWQPLSLKSSLLVLPTLFVVLVITIRGGFTVKPISIINAFVDGSSELANLTLNGVYTGVITSMSEDDLSQKHHFYSEQEIKEKTGKTYTYPFVQKAVKKTLSDQPVNVVLLQIESLNYEFIDALANNDYQVTPFLDELVTKSWVANQFFASGQRSIDGLQATWTSIPALPYQVTLHDGLSSSKISKIAQEAKQLGYYSLFAQSSPRESFRINSIMQSLGFDDFYGLEDVKLTLDYIEPPEYGYDYETLQLLADKLKLHFSNSEKPVLAGFFSGTTHQPYIRLPEPFTKYQHDAHGLNGMLNSVNYLDWSLKQFFKSIEQEPWFENTVFLITADHTNAKFLKPNKDAIQRFHIPLIIYSPALIHAGKMTQQASQLDIMPTLYTLLGIEKPYAGIGESIFAKKQNPLMMIAGYTLTMKNSKGYVSSNLQNIIDTNLVQPQAEQLHQQLLMYDQLIAQSIQLNTWAQ